MDELARARDAMRRGDHGSAETILDAILEGPGEITSHVLFDVTFAYEELFSAKGAYEDLIRACRRCAERARQLPPLDFQIHSANALIITAGAERTLGRRNDAERHARAADRALAQFPPERFGAGSRERVIRLRARLKSLEKDMEKAAVAPRPGGPPSGVDSTAEPEEWRSFASRKNLQVKDVKAYLARMRRSAGPAKSLAAIAEWAVNTPRAGNMGSSPECFAALIEELGLLAASEPLPFDSQSKLLGAIHGWEQEGPWLQRLIIVNRKLGLAEKLRQLKGALHVKALRILDAIEARITALEMLDGGAILDGYDGQDHEGLVLQLQGDLDQLAAGLPCACSPRLQFLRSRLGSIVAAADEELRKRDEAYARLLEAIREAPNRPALAELKAAVKRKLPAAMQTRPELTDACERTDNRLLAAEVEALESQERAAHLARLSGVRGVNLTTLLFREYGVDLQTARRLVIDHNNGAIDLDRLLDSVLEIARRKNTERQSK